MTSSDARAEKKGDAKGEQRGVEALVALGSNWEDAPSRIESALARLAELPNLRLLKTSDVRSTRPVGVARQPDFLNAVVLAETTLDPFALLRALQGIEAELGRVRKEFWGPRTIDLDLILYGDVVLDTKELKVPHPRVCWRDFVLDPACEIAPEKVLPVFGLTFREARALLYSNFRSFETASYFWQRACSFDAALI